MAFFTKIKHAFGFNENGDDLDDELGYDLTSAPYVNPFRKEERPGCEERRATVEEQDDYKEEPRHQSDVEENPQEEERPAEDARVTPSHQPEISDAEHRIMIAQQRANMLTQRVVDMENKMHKLENELIASRTVHKREIKAMQETLAQAKADVEKAEEKVRNARSEVEKMEQENRALRERFDQLIKGRNELEGQINTRVEEAFVNADKQNDDLKNEVEKLNGVIESMKAEAAEQAERQRNLETDKNNRIDDLKRQLATAAALVDDYRDEMNLAKKQMAQAVEQQGVLADEVEEYKQLLHESQAAEMTALNESERLKKETDRALRAKNHAVAELETLQNSQTDAADQANAEHQKLIDQLVAEAKQSMEAADQLKAKVVDRDAQLERVTAEVKSLRQQLDETKGKSAQLDKELTACKNQISQLEDENKRYGDIAGQHVATARHLEESKLELDSLRKQNVASQGEIHRLANDLAVAQAEVERLRNELNEKVAEPKAEKPKPARKIEFVTSDEEKPQPVRRASKPVKQEPIAEPQIEAQPEPADIISPVQEPVAEVKEAVTNQVEVKVVEETLPVAEVESVAEPEPEPVQSEPSNSAAPVAEGGHHEHRSPTLDDMDDVDWLMPVEAEPEPESVAELEPEPEPEPEPVRFDDPRQLSLF